LGPRTLWPRLRNPRRAASLRNQRESHGEDVRDFLHRDGTATRAGHAFHRPRSSPGQEGRTVADNAKWQECAQQIVDKARAPRRCRAMGLKRLKLAATKPTAKGWLPCHAIAREDHSASAAIFVGEGKARGRYRDMGRFWPLPLFLGIRRQVRRLPRLARGPPPLRPRGRHLARGRPSRSVRPISWKFSRPARKFSPSGRRRRAALISTRSWITAGATGDTRKRPKANTVNLSSPFQRTTRRR